MKVIIVGGGIAGLSAGIHARLRGYECEIIEKNSYVGGECTGWKRGDFYIDNCIHWLMGTKKNTELYEAWRQVGALDDSVEVYYPESFYVSEYQGQRITLWEDLEKTKKEMIALSPEDKKQINRFIKNVKNGMGLAMPVEAPPELMSKKQLLKLLLPMIKMASVLKKYDKITISEYAKTFRHPLLQRMVTDYLSTNSAATSLFTSYGTFVERDGGIPKGFSAGVPNRMAKKFVDLGGKITLNSPVLSVAVENGFVKGVKTEDNYYECDKIIFSTDFEVTYSLLGKQYRPAKLAQALEDFDTYPVHSEFQIAFYTDTPLESIKSTTVFETEEMLIGRRTFTRLGVRAYEYDNFAPEGKHIYQCCLVQYKDDYDYWKELADRKDGSYAKAKQSQAEIIARQIEKYTNVKVNLIDVWTPYTYYKWCGAYLGSYMSFMRTPTSKIPTFPSKVEGLSNCYIGSQWQRKPGGLATALTMGKFAVQWIEKDEKSK